MGRDEPGNPPGAVRQGPGGREPPPTPPPARKGARANPLPRETRAVSLVPREEARKKTRVPGPRHARRDKLVEGAVQSRNPFFKRPSVNYVWSKMLGRALVEPI